MNIELNNKIPKFGRFAFQEYKQYKGYHTYYSKRGYYVASDEQGNIYHFKKIEAKGKTEEEAIIALKHAIIKRHDDIKDYLDKVLQDNLQVLESMVYPFKESRTE